MSQAHEKGHYRELTQGAARAEALEGVALAILQEEKLTPEDRETLEKAVRVARALKRTHAPEVEP
jgi:hypothetical protein